MLSFRALDGIVHATWRAQDDATGEDKRAAAASSSPDAVAASLAGDAAVRTARAELLFSRGTAWPRTASAARSLQQIAAPRSA